MRGDCYYHVLSSYDRGSELARFGPGAAHLHDLLRFAIGRGFRKFDFSVGDERYKHEWCDSEMKLYDHVAVATLRGACAALPIVVLRELQAVDQAEAGAVECVPPCARAARFAEDRRPLTMQP